MRPKCAVVVLHEFGHALGRIDEHAWPNVPIPWHKPKVYADDRQDQHWDSATVDANIFRRYEPVELEPHEPFEQKPKRCDDDKSVTQYAVPAERTSDGSSIAGNMELREMDKT